MFSSLLWISMSQPILDSKTTKSIHPARKFNEWKLGISSAYFQSNSINLVWIRSELIGNLTESLADFLSIRFNLGPQNRLVSQYLLFVGGKLHATSFTLTESEEWAIFLTLFIRPFCNWHFELELQWNGQNKGENSLIPWLETWQWDHFSGQNLHDMTFDFQYQYINIFCKRHNYFFSFCLLLFARSPTVQNNRKKLLTTVDEFYICIISVIKCVYNIYSS